MPLRLLTDEGPSRRGATSGHENRAGDTSEGRYFQGRRGTMEEADWTINEFGPFPCRRLSRPPSTTAAP